MWQQCTANHTQTCYQKGAPYAIVSTLTNMVFDFITFFNDRFLDNRLPFTIEFPVKRFSLDHLEGGFGFLYTEIEYTPHGQLLLLTINNNTLKYNS